MNMCLNSDWLRRYYYNYKSTVNGEFVLSATAPPPPVGQGLLIHTVFGKNNDTPQSVGRLWTSDESVAETST